MHTLPCPTLSRLTVNAWRFAFVLVVFLLTFLGRVHAQTASGTITGSVIDAATGKFLEGADVVVEGTTLRTTSAREGSFELRNVPAGPHTITVTYPGLEAKSVAVTVPADQTVGVPVRLNGDVMVLEEFKVSSVKQGMAQAVALQKASLNMKVVAASDQYGDIAEGNAAEYLKFLPGVGIDYNANDARAVTLRGISTQFTNVTMDGNPIASATSGNLNRRFEFEQVSINNVETIEVVKTLTPEMQATSTAGSINLVSKSAFDREGNLGTYRVYFQALNDDLYLKKTEGWGQEKTRKILPGIDVNYSFHVGEKLGFDIAYKNSQLFNDYPRSSYTWEYNPANGGTPTNPVLTSWNLQNEQKDTRRQAFSTRMDYKLSDTTKISLLGDWNFYDLLFTDRVVTINTGTLAPLATTSTPNTGSTVTGLA
ncbi:MAG TPA: carboxypeptidase regulatory-like domain-containing protein, partial [Opitutaceae bacterium]|nr:carboxypeptidase regulatory-like domain-containing protein [Opitutaceae bacterium]